jgi:DNA-binding XRE family transcriptional regulator
MSRRDTVTRAEFEALAARVEDLQDVVLLARAEAAAADREYLPAKMVERIISGENRVRLWRQHRGLTEKALARAAGVDAAYLSQIETGKKPGSVAAFKKLAKALRVKVDDLTH